MNSFAVRACRHIFAEGISGLACDEVIGIGPASMWHNGRIISRSMGCDAQGFGEAANPHHIGLENINCSLSDELAKTIARIFMLSRCPLQGGVSAFNLAVPIIIVW